MASSNAYGPLQMLWRSSRHKILQNLSLFRQRRKVVLSDTLQTGDHVSTQDKAKAQQLLQELAALLLQAPDPLPFLVGSQELQQALTEVQKENRRLQKDTQAAENEATSAISMVGQVQKLEAARTETESKLHAETEKALL
ncbi:hypothetical protein WJX73_003139 [Symbiochloris irregularis]|uniref:Uncharacterized protein n=1 Tax=Symbiochloris irregularis TaxID=706552 RepID=A0AAW1PIP6_9CHLO